MRPSQPPMTGSLLLKFLMFSATLMSAFPQGNLIRIPNLGDGLDSPATNIEGGPCVGMVLNVHFFPGIQDYLKGNYRIAMAQMNYVLLHPSYIEMNPKKDQYISLGHYIRGMIYLYHAEGLGKLQLAKVEFEQSILKNSNNFFAHLELARTYVLLGFKPQAVQTLERLLELNPEPSVAQQVRQELALLRSK